MKTALGMASPLRRIVFAAALAAIGCGPDSAPKPTPARSASGTNGPAAPSASSSAPQAAASASAAQGTATSAAASATSVVPTASASTKAPATPKRYAKLTDDEVAKLVTPQLVGGETLAHPVFRGPFGPSQSTLVVLTKKSDGGLTQFGGFLLYERDGKMQKLALPPLHDAWDGQSIEALAFAPDADADKVEEALIIGRYMTGAGPDGAKPFAATTVIDVNGTDVTRLTDMEDLAGAIDSIAGVRQAFRSRTLVLRLDGAPTLLAPTLNKATAAGRFSRLLGAKPAADTAEQLQFHYGQKKDDAPVRCTMEFGKEGRLTKLSVAAPDQANSSAASMKSWLQRRRAKSSKVGESTSYEYNGWTIVIGPDSSDVEKPSLVVTPKK